MNKLAAKERMTEDQIIKAIQNNFQPFGGNCWVRLGDSTLYDDFEVLTWLQAKKLL